MKARRGTMQPGQAKCGAKTRSGATPGAPCKDIAMANGRCKRHGGKSTGPKTPNPATGPASGVYTHGIYTKYFREDEKVLIDEKALQVGQVESELTVVRIRLKRALEAKEKWEASLATGDGSEELVLVETTEGQRLSKEGVAVDVDEKKLRLPDFEGIIDRCLARIESLEKTRKELLKATEDPDGDGDDPAVPTRDRITFTGGLTGDDEEPPSPFPPAPGK